MASVQSLVADMEKSETRVIFDDPSHSLALFSTGVYGSWSQNACTALLYRSTAFARQVRRGSLARPVIPAGSGTIR